MKNLKNNKFLIFIIIALLIIAICVIALSSKRDGNNKRNNNSSNSNASKTINTIENNMMQNDISYVSGLNYANTKEDGERVKGEEKVDNVEKVDGTKQGITMDKTVQSEKAEGENINDVLDSKALDNGRIIDEIKTVDNI